MLDVELAHRVAVGVGQLHIKGAAVLVPGVCPDLRAPISDDAAVADRCLAVAGVSAAREGDVSDVREAEHILFHVRAEELNREPAVGEVGVVVRDCCGSGVIVQVKQHHGVARRVVPFIEGEGTGDVADHRRVVQALHHDRSGDHL